MVAACGALVAIGCGVLASGTAGAAPEADPNYPLGGQGTQNQQEQSNPEHSDPDQRIEQAPDKAEKLGGGTVGKLLDLGTDIIKCGLNIATPSVKCEL